MGTIYKKDSAPIIPCCRNQAAPDGQETQKAKKQVGGQRRCFSPPAIAKEASWSDVQAASDLYDADQRGIADSPLDFTQVGGVQSR